MAGKKRRKKAATQKQREELMRLELLDLTQPYKSNATRAAKYRRRHGVISPHLKRVEEKGKALKKKGNATGLVSVENTFPERPKKGPESRATKGQPIKVDDGLEFNHFRGWKKKYLEVLRDTGDRNLAIRKCGNKAVNTLVIERACDPSNDGYDPRFKDEIRSLEKAMVWQIEDNYLQRALKDPNHAKMVLQTRVGERYAAMNEALRQATGMGPGVVTNHFWFTQDDQGRSVDMLKQLFPEKRDVKLIEHKESANGSGAQEEPVNAEGTAEADRSEGTFAEELERILRSGSSDAGDVGGGEGELLPSDGAE